MQLIIAAVGHKMPAWIEAGFSEYAKRMPPELRIVLKEIKPVERSGILVFASHSTDFLARLCKTAIWIDHGSIKMMGEIEDVVRAYEGDDAARHVAEIIAEMSRQ